MDGFNIKDIERQIGPSIAPNITGKSIGSIISDLLPYFFAGAGLLLLLFLLYGGLGLMLSRGDPKAVQGAKDKITGAVVGFVIVFVAYWLVQIIGTIFGIEAFKDIFG